MQKTKKTLFEYTASLINGEKVSLSKFKGKDVYLLVNVASECDEIQHVVRKKTGAKIKYPMFEKLKVNGDDCHDIYTFLKQNSRLWNEQKGKCENPNIAYVTIKSNKNAVTQESVYL
ncbi:Thioredoxin-like fold [Pseudocohnilembus persalinus]|uniref:Thioredoxin-like fold n=1 Tax=Pseudocohnilembus persalinus TaxID=266149 RepID=A0A0V0R6I3_PSEPJ|nr:Thioredoxin-like fold [Pseudocohnilembus persalinus]|eukprot:KRX09768.1 Thioredoxin-like fold [Pseudocohnilembus persalinus]